MPEPDDHLHRVWTLTHATALDSGTTAVDVDGETATVPTRADLTIELWRDGESIRVAANAGRTPFTGLDGGLAVVEHQLLPHLAAQGWHVDDRLSGVIHPLADEDEEDDFVADRHADIDAEAAELGDSGREGYHR